MQTSSAIHTPGHDRARLAGEILSYWLSDLDDASRFDPTTEPFARCYARWYGKRPDVDAEIRQRFEPALVEVTRALAGSDRELDAWAEVPGGLLALVILLDQLPRNMYRGTPRMYAHDPLAFSVARVAMRALEQVDMPLVHRMFLYVPLLHVERLDAQDEAVGRFARLAAAAAERSPQNTAFFARALDSARRHAEVIATHGRFPHRNAILGRVSTPAEEVYLRGPDPGF